MQPLSYAPGDVVKIKTLRRQREGNPEEIIDESAEGCYSTIHEAWFDFDELIFIRRADKESMEKLKKSWNGEE